MSLAVLKGLADRRGSFEKILTDLNKEKEIIMNDIDVKQQERQRMQAVLESDVIRGREQIAGKMLATTDLSANQILDILKDIPQNQAQAVTPFEKVMAQIPKPQIVTADTDNSDNMDVMAQRIASLANTSSGE